MAQALMLPSTAMLDSYHQASLLTRPEGKRLTKLEQEMGNILARTDISEAQKLDLFGATLENFKRVRGEIINNGLMLTPVNVPQKETSAEDIFKKLQAVIQQAMGGAEDSQQPLPAANILKSQPSQVSAASASVPSTSQGIPATSSLKKKAQSLQAQLLRSANISIDPKTSQIILAGKKYSSGLFHEALSKITSNDDYNTTDPQVHAVTQLLYKALLKSNHDISALARKHGYFQQLMTHTQISPRLQKEIAKHHIAVTSQSRTAAPRTRRKIKSLTDLTGGGMVNFNTWDRLYDFLSDSDELD